MLLNLLNKILITFKRSIISDHNITLFRYSRYFYQKDNFYIFLRRLLLILIDTFIIFLSINLTANIFDFSDQFLSSTSYKNLRTLTIIIGIFIYLISGQYKGLSRYLNSTSFYQLALRNFALVLLYLIYSSFIETFNFSNYYYFNLFLALTFFTGVWRILIRDAFQRVKVLNNNIKNIAIYGAGSGGVQLEASLRLNKIYKIAYFLDDDPSLIGRTIHGIKILNPNYLKNYKNKIDQIFLAIPSLKNEDKRRILNKIKVYNLPIFQIPSINEITTGKESINTLKPIMIEDLLGRDLVQPDNNILGREVKDNIICVTGAGGSIGSELCRQIYELKPKKLILFELSELSLYKICKEFSTINSENIEIIPILGNCLDINLLERVFIQERVNLIFHAAAYKHVPLVEINPISGILNNVFSTLNITKTAIDCDIEKVILISSDKAVRPTNVMGASKRLSELIIQAYANDIDSSLKTKLSMVRFGNVLGSSGSVVPLFREQIALGGPITLTDKNVMRYFMTIQEASNLVLQAASLAKGGELFMLQMGQPIKIIELAKQMISLSGLTIKDNKNPNGDIEIVLTGLRPGEKLYEELLIDAKSKPTIHPLIFKANEKFLSKRELLPILDKLKNNLENQNNEEVIAIMRQLIPEWKVNN